MRERLVTFKGTLARAVYVTDSFSVYAMNVDTSKYNVKINKFNNVSICGELPSLTKGVEYEVLASEEIGKYGVSYRVSNIRRDEPLTKQGVRSFLEEIVSPNIAYVLTENYPDIIERVKNGNLDDIDLSKMHGIGPRNFQKIVDKITENFYLSDLASEFHGVLSMAMLKKIYDVYGSSDLLKEKLIKAPYTTLTRISGIGFRTADDKVLTMQEEGILDFGFDIRTSRDRCLSCIRYVLEENEYEGHTKMDVRELYKQVDDIVHSCIDKFADAIDDNSIYYDSSTKDVALKRTHDMENDIAKTIVSNIKGNNVWSCDIEKYRKIDDVELSDEQLKTLDNLCNNNICILNGPAGCVDCDTEYFNGTEWKKISDFTYGEKVLQYNDDGTANLVYPMNYIKQPAEYLWEFKTKYGLNQCLSDNHNCYYITSRGNLKSRPFKEIRKMHNEHAYGFSGKFITTFDYSGTGIDLTDDEIRLMVATFADGSFYYRDNCSSDFYNQARFHLKKSRKKDRLLDIASRLNINVRIAQSAADGYDDFYIKVPFRAKHYPTEWYNCNKHQLQVIADEVMFWDGEYKKNNKYSTTCKSDADFIQFVYSAIGYRATICINDRVGEKYATYGNVYERKSIEYSVLYTKRTMPTMCCDTRKNHTKTPITQYKTKDGYEYCFTVPSHMLVLRREDRIFITGNCGKSFSTKSVIAMLEDMGKTYRLFAPTGKASKVLSDFTKRPASTIHRGLGYNPSQGWTLNRYNPIMSDVVIVDEMSMVDVELFWHLIDAIDFSCTKLLMIGDDSQLPSVGCGNLLHDFMMTNVIPTVSLTKIFRYGEGGLMKVATDIRLGRNYLNNTMKNFATSFGKNDDYVFIDVPQKKSTAVVVASYKNALEKGYGVDDIQVITPKNVGNYGTEKLNPLLQKIANPNCGKTQGFQIGERVYYVGDLVIECVNNYDAPMAYEDGVTAFVANGETGTIKSIEGNSVVIDFDGIDVRYNKETMNMVKLGYAITCHKSQGSSINYVILLTPQSDIYTLNSNLLYVGCTRAKNRCVHIGSVDTVNKVIKKRANFARHTFMQQMLKSYVENMNKQNDK